MAREYDLVIIGGGTGGYVAAIRASQLGLKTAIVEKEKLGGTCLHKGCIPSKALLRSAEVYRTVQNSDTFGIETNEVTINFQKVQERKNNIVQTLFNGVNHLMKQGKIDIYHGTGRLMGSSIFSPMAGTVSVEMDNGEENEILVPKNVIIATGSKPRLLEGLNVDGKYILTSDEALELENLPKSMIIVGGGVIGVEWASLLCDFGVEVTLLEYSDQILPTEDKEIAKEMSRQLKKRKMNVVTNVEILPNWIQIIEGEGITVNGIVNGKTETFQGEKLLLSVGRVPNIEGIGIENTNIEIKNGVIVTNDFYQTKESHIYAIGDCIGGMQLAHVASKEGIIAVEHMAGKTPEKLDYTSVPRCIYSFPEVASVGLTEKEAIDKGYEIKIGKFPFRANGKALVFGESDGFVKMIACKDTNDLLGVHLIGPKVTELIAESSLAKLLDAIPWEISESIHPHPSLSETIGEAALAVDGKAIHFS